MADNSDSSFLDKVRGLPEMATNQVKHDYAQVMQNKADREAIIAREKNSNALTPSQKEQLSYISNASDAQKFVDASMLGNENGDYTAGQSVYKESLKSSGKAWGDVAVNAAELYAGGALTKGIFSAGSKLIGSLSKGSRVAERIEPTMGKAFESEFSAAQKVRREQEAIQKAQSGSGYWKEKIGKGTTTNTERAGQTVNQERRATQEAEELRADQSRNPFNNRMPKDTTESSSGNKGIFGSILSGTWGATKFATKSILGTGLGLTAIGGGLGYLGYKNKDYLQGKASEMGTGWINKNVPSYLQEPATKILNDSIYGEKKEGEGNEGGNGGETEGDGERGPNLIEKAGAGIVGAAVASGNPFKGVKGLVSGVGSLFPSRSSAESTLSSMPSGGDSGMTGEGHFEEGGLAGNTVLEVLNKIYRVLTTTKNITEDIARNVSSLIRAQGQQDASRDLMSSNLSARQNEGGSASIINSGGGRDDDYDNSNSSKKEGGGVLDSLMSMAGSAGKFAKKWAFPAAVAGGVGASMFFGKDAEASVKDPTASVFKQNGNTGHSNIPVDIHGVDDEYLKNTAFIESAGKLDAKPTSSSAQGLWQFTAGTWKDTVAAMGKNYSLADRNDPKKAEEVMKFFTARNQQLFKQKTGRLPTNKESYMSHFLGATGASNFANANPNASAASVNPSAAKANYNIFYDKKTGRKRTVAEVTNIMGGRYDEGLAALRTGKLGKYGDNIRNIGSNQTETPSKDTGTVITVDGDKNELPPPPNHFEKNEKDTNLKVSLNDTNKATPINSEVQEVDIQKAVLQEERNKLAKLSPSNEKDMTVQLDRLNDINTEMVALNKRRNDVTGSAEYQANMENRKAAGMQQASMKQQQPSMSQQLQGPRSPAGVSKAVPKVRNDDPTLMMVERDNLWNTNSHNA